MNTISLTEKLKAIDNLSPLFGEGLYRRTIATVCAEYAIETRGIGLNIRDIAYYGNLRLAARGLKPQSYSFYRDLVLKHGA